MKYSKLISNPFSLWDYMFLYYIYFAIKVKCDSQFLKDKLVEPGVWPFAHLPSFCKSCLSKLLVGDQEEVPVGGPKGDWEGTERRRLLCKGQRGRKSNRFQFKIEVYV